MIREDGCARGMMPAGEKLEAGELAASQLDDGLKDGEELVMIQRPLEIGRIDNHWNNLPPIAKIWPEKFFEV